ncbi:relaxase/mobilization nuclease domain-containing protein [Aliarcobacter butzleri]|uniref:relaxase/mobilization nuclease domain-containing protein n=1 Tax=Aliarcobacter butzleri TaxID=28197 RepID=UPI003B21AC8B
MNDFLSSMKSLVLYQHITDLSKEKNKNKSKDNLEDELQLEMIKYKKAISKGASPSNAPILSYKDYSSVINKIDSPMINANENIKDTLGKDSGLQSLVSKASSQSNVANGSSSTESSGSSSLSNYSATFSSTSINSTPVIKQFGLVKMTGTEGKNQNGYTIGKGAKERASASLDYITRDENGKPISDLKDKDGNVVSKIDAKEQIKNIEAERRLVLSPNPRLNLTQEQLDKVVRDTMSSYSKSFGKEFDYFYAIHNNTKTPHAHILMTSTHPDGDGIRMYKDELFELKMNFEDNLKELVKDYGINIKDESTIPTSRQIANFIGAIPDTSLFLQNKFLAEKISKKFDLDFNSKDIKNNPEKLENWFLKNDKSYKEYFMSATNKDAFLFQDYIKVAEDLSQKYDLSLTKNTTTNIKEFKNWLEEKQEIFLANRISQDKNIILQKDDVSDKNKLYKWFKENETDVKEWNEKYKYFPSKQMSSLAQKYSNMVDIKPDNILESRKETRDFVKNYTRNPLIYAGDSRKSLYEVLEVKKEQYKNEFFKQNITKKSFVTETERISTLQKRLIQSQEITESSLKRYNLDTNIYSTDSKTIQIDGIKFLASENTKELLTNKINSHVENLTKENTDEYSKNYIKKATALNYIISKSNNISVSALENIGLNKEKDLQDFKIEKVDTELKIINFKNTDLNNDKDDIKSAEDINKDRPLTHQLTLNNTEDFSIERNTLTEKFNTTENYEELNLNNYQDIQKAFISSNQEINNSNINEFHTLLSLAIEDKNIEVMDSLYKLDSEYKDDLNLLELKFVSYAEALNISKDDVYTKMLEKYFNLNNEEIKSLDNLEKAFDTYFELSGEEKENLSPEDLKHQLYAENLVELVTNEYEHYMWKYFDMDNENVSEDNMKAYFEATQNLTDEALKLNDLISQNLEIKQLQNEIEELLENGNFKQAQELIQDERLENTTRNFFEYIYESMLNDENVLDEVYEKVINNINLEEKTYETFKQDNFLKEMKKIDLEGELMNEILEEMKQQELEEYELTLGGE